MADVTGPGTVETVPGRDGNTYELEPLAGLGRWVEMRHPVCGKRVEFVNPRADRVRWFADSHRCRLGNWQGS